MDTLQRLQPYGPLPTARQMRHQRREMYGFIHFTINTFTDKEWGYGDESPTLFDPSDFNADQIARVAAQAGMAGLILTCKHHDGFCLWPTQTTAHSVTNSPFRDGNGDVVREMSDACRQQGIAFGVYLSPWDRNNALYGTPEYVTEVYRPQLRELLTNYGPLFEVWFDGANGGDGYYGGVRETRTIDPATYYDWEETWRMVRELQPDAVMFSDIGPDVRWIGNEQGIAGDPCWATLQVGTSVPGVADHQQLNRGDRNGETWLVPECDVSIRPGWFWHASEDDRVRSGKNLNELYFQSVGRGATFLLNLAPDRRGQIPDRDMASLRAWNAHRRMTFGENKAVDAVVTPPPTNGLHIDRSVIVTLPEARRVNVVRLRESLGWGQRVDSWELDAWRNGAWETVVVADAIGAQRILRFETVTSDQLRLRITALTVERPVLSEIAFFWEPEFAEDCLPTTTTASLLVDATVKQEDRSTILFDTGRSSVTIGGFVYSPDLAGGLITDRYAIAVSSDGETWEAIAEGEFSNIRNNPVEQTVSFAARQGRFVRFQATRFAVGDRIEWNQVRLHGTPPVSS